MTYFPETTVGFLDDETIGGDGRLRQSGLHQIFSSKFTVSKLPLVWNESLVTGGTVTFGANTGGVSVAVTASSGSSAIFQTKKYFPNRVGKSHLFVIPILSGAAVTNNVKRFGVYDANNGYFFEISSGTLKVVRRSFVTGSAVDTSVAQSSWNIDKMDGSGISGITIDLTKIQSIVIDFTHNGRVRFGFIISGLIYYCHYILVSNILTAASMSNSSLPVRIESINTGAASVSSIISYGASVFVEGEKDDIVGQPFSFMTTATRNSGNAAMLPLVSFRLKSTNIRDSLLIQSLSIRSVLNDPIVYLILNPVLTGASWVSVDANSACEVDVSATAISGGTNLRSYAISTQVRQLNIDLKRDEWIEVLANIAGVSDILCIGAFGVGGASAMLAGLNWIEVN